MKPIFPFKVHIKNHSFRRSIRVLRAVSYFVIILFIINALIAFSFLVLTKEKNISPQFISFDLKTHSFIIPQINKKRKRIEKTSRNVLREKFVTDYVLKRETWQADMAKNHHRLCNCISDEREIKLIEKTRNRTVIPRCSVCLMSTQDVFKDFLEKTYLVRREKSKNNWKQLPKLVNIKLYKIIPPERGGDIFIYKIIYKIKNQSWVAFASVRDLKYNKNKKNEYLFKIVDYGVMK